ncbi:MAG: DUF2975 domain-containing protein [Patescibacteria group bacterium]
MITIKRSALFLQVVTVLVGIGVAAFLLIEPHFEGRNVDATLFAIYFNDPFLAYVYTASILFFVALYHAWTLLGHMRDNTLYTLQSVRALRAIRYCAVVLIAFIMGAEAYFFIVQRSTEDIAGGVVLGLFVLFVSVIVAVTAHIFEGLLQSTIATKSENNSTQ